MSITISSIYFSPVKSISFQKISKCQIRKNLGIVNDRLFAFSRLLDSKQAHKMEKDPKERKLINFLSLKNTPPINKYKFEFNKYKLEFFEDKKKMLSVNPNYPSERVLIEDVILNLDKLIKGPIFLLKNNKYPFFDTTTAGEVMNSISLINSNSIKDFEEKIGKKVEYQRFRGNFYIDGLSAWHEREWVGKKISINGLPFKVVDNIPRCSATNLKPRSDLITMNLPQQLKKFYNHFDLGVYILPQENGVVSNGDKIYF